MEKLSGLVIDVYDDSDGGVLRELFPGSVDLTELEKTAHPITPEERESLPDDAFALVLVDGDVVMKKFATVDQGNTALSVMYFMKTAHRLPVEAQHIAAENLWAACEQHGLEAPEELKKVALDLRKEALNPVGLLSAGLVVPGQAREAKKNLAAVRGSHGMVMTPEQLQQRKAQMGMY